MVDKDLVRTKLTYIASNLALLDGKSGLSLALFLIDIDQQYVVLHALQPFRRRWTSQHTSSATKDGKSLHGPGKHSQLLPSAVYWLPTWPQDFVPWQLSVI